MEKQEPNASSGMSQLREEVQGAFTAADESAGQAVVSLESVHKARLSRLSRAVASAKQQYGANDSRVKDLEHQATATSATVARIAAVKQQTQTAAPAVAPNGWAVHGRVFHSDMKPAGAFTVFLVDASKTYQRQLPFAYTDKTGYFLLNYAGADTGAEKVPPLYVEVADANGRPVYLDAPSFTPSPGSITYRNIVLGSGDKPIGDPPPEIKDNAVPPKGKKK